jgi:Tfp pilus assembly protein PilO
MLPKTKKVAVVSVVVFLCIIALYAGLRYVIAREERAVHEQMTARGTVEDRQRSLLQLSKALAETEGERAELASAVVSDEGVTEFLELVERIAREEGLTINTTSVGVEPLPKSTKFELLALSHEVKGSYTQVMRFVSLLETLPYQVTLQSVSLDRTVEADAPNLWRGTISIAATKIKSI